MLRNESPFADILTFWPVAIGNHCCESAANADCDTRTSTDKPTNEIFLILAMLSATFNDASYELLFIRG